MTTPHAAVDRVIAALAPDPEPDAIADAFGAIESVGALDRDAWEHWLEALTAATPLPHGGGEATALLERTLRKLHVAMLGPQGFAELPDGLDFARWAAWHRELASDATGRSRLVLMLARDGSSPALDALLAIWRGEAPTDERGTDEAFATLMQRGSGDLPRLFPDLFDIAATPAFAAAVLDLANFLFRSGTVDLHPAAERLPRLRQLLERLTVELEKIENDPSSAGTPAEVQTKIAASLSLGVALCDCFALTRYEPAIATLRYAMSLGHRRLRCEAAWGLARLGDESGVTELVMLAEEPVARLRVIAYADELGVGDRIPPELRTDEAMAESEMAIWLSEPGRMGLAPAELTCVDRRRLAWPGYDDPSECRLWKYVYDFGRGRYENLGITGPRPLAVTVDLIGLPFDEVYALFAGLQAEHEEILEQDVRDLAPGHAPEIARLERRLKDRGLDEIVPLRFGSFFGERVLVARAKFGGRSGIAVADSIEVLWRPDRNRQRPLGPDECHAIYRGRKLLGAFNEGFVASDEES